MPNDNNNNERNMSITELENLSQLSNIIRTEAKFMLPKSNDLAKELFVRPGRLWYTYFSKGILLSHGGVEESFIKLDDLPYSSSLEAFNIYRSDRRSAFVTPAAAKQFLAEENAISTQNFDKLAVSFCLGSHEGAMRVARCIYRKGINDEILFAMGSYGLMAAAIASMKPVPYKTQFIKIDKNNGEKIHIADLNELIQTHPTAKTLFLELKTTAGAIYKPSELKEIIAICKQNNIFLIADATHNNMEYSKENAFPDVSDLCCQLNYDEFAVIYTGSKTYGLERARVGFMVLSPNCKSSPVSVIDTDLYRVIGAGFDLPFEIADKLVKTSITDRQSYLQRFSKNHRYNMNLMLAYIEGIDSPRIDADVRDEIKSEINPAYHNGIAGLKVVFKPEAGIHMKIDTSGLADKYFTNIRLFNSEMFCYALNKMAGVVTLHSYCIMDPSGYAMRLTYSIKKDVHLGMKAIHDFVKKLDVKPNKNIFMPDIHSAENLIFGNNVMNPNRLFALNDTNTVINLNENTKLQAKL